MTRNGIGKLVAVLANVGVIAGIAFLAVEIHQNNELMAAQARFNQLSAQTETHIILAENPSLAWSLVRANRDEEVSPQEEASLEYYVRSVFTKMQWTFREIPREQLPLERWREIGGETYRRRFWETYKDEFDPDFIQFMDEEVFGNR